MTAHEGETMAKVTAKELIRRLVIRSCRQVARSLMTGNDTGCFTPSDFAARWCALGHVGGATSPKLAEAYLRAFAEDTGEVVEVRAGVWTAEPPCDVEADEIRDNVRRFGVA